MSLPDTSRNVLIFHSLSLVVITPLEPPVMVPGVEASTNGQEVRATERIAILIT